MMKMTGKSLQRISTVSAGSQNGERQLEYMIQARITNSTEQVSPARSYRPDGVNVVVELR